MASILVLEPEDEKRDLTRDKDAITRGLAASV